MQDAVERARASIAAQPQHLLLTLLGDYWYPRADELPSTALVDLLGEFGVSETNARAALSRLGRRGLLASRRVGRQSLYALTDEGRETLDEGTRRIFTFGDRRQDWDRRWTVVVFSVPEENRSVRSALRTRLGWLGFAALLDAVWVAPGNREKDAADLLAALEVATATVVVGEVSSRTLGGDPSSAWDLDQLRDRYHGFLGEFRPVATQGDPSALTGREALVARTAVIDVWRSFPGSDPELPAELLPADWPQREARELFTALYDRLGPAATDCVREVLARHGEDLAERAEHHTSRNALELVRGPLQHR